MSQHSSEESEDFTTTYNPPSDEYCQIQSNNTWNYRYLILTVLGLGLIGGKMADLPLIKELSGFHIASLLVSMYTVLSLLHWHSQTA